MRRFCHMIPLLLLSCLLHPQARLADSLIRCIQKQRVDTLKADHLLQLGVFLSQTGEFRLGDSVNRAVLDLISRLMRETPASRRSQLVKLRERHSAALRNMGLIAEGQGNYERAIEFYTQSLKDDQALGHARGVIISCNSLGNTYAALQDHDKALHYLHLSLRMSETIKDEKFIAANLDNIALAHNEKKDHSKALLYYRKALDLAIARKDSTSQALELINTGGTYLNMRQYDSALAFYERARSLIRTDEKGQPLAFIFIAMGHVFEARAQYREALGLFQKGLDLSRREGDKMRVIQALQSIGHLFHQTQRYAEAAEKYQAALQMAEEEEDWITIKECHEGLSEVFRALKLEDRALKHLKEFVRYRDSIANEDYSRGLLRDGIAYEFRKKESEAGLLREKKLAVATMRSQKQRVVLFGAGVLLLCILLSAVYILRSLRGKRRLNAALRLQKQLLDIRQKEILDSMRYASRIQRSMITSEQYIARCLQELRL